MTIIKASLTLASVLALSASAFAADKAAKGSLKDTLSAESTELWQTFKDKKVEAFTAMLTDDFVNIDWSGVAHKADIGGAIPDYSDVDFKLDNFALVKVDRDCAVLTYHVAFHGNYKGKPAGPTSINASDVYVKRGGKWLAILHQETAAP